MNGTLLRVRDRWIPRLNAFGENPALSAVRTGMVAVNGLPSASSTSLFAPFGGYKRSGVGRELGMSALAFYTETKTVTVDLS